MRSRKLCLRRRAWHSVEWGLPATTTILPGISGRANLPAYLPCMPATYLPASYLLLNGQFLGGDLFCIHYHLLPQIGRGLLFSLRSVTMGGRTFLGMPSAEEE